MARPEYWKGSLKEDAITTIMERIQEGESLRSVLSEKRDKKLLPSRKLFNEWLNSDTNLSDQYVRACMERADIIFEEILKYADAIDNCNYIDKMGNERVDWGKVQRNRLQIDARKWMLGKMNPKKYGDRVQNLNINTEVEYKDVPEWLRPNKD